MVTSRSPSSLTARATADALDDVLAELASMSVSPSSTAQPPVPSVRHPRFSADATAAPTSTPSSAASSGFGGVKGHLKGKETLLLTDSTEMIDSMCRGYIGGPRGPRERFCRNVVSSPDEFCCPSHAGEKFEVLLSHLYIKMASMSALCSPCISLEDAERMGMGAIQESGYGSREWLALLMQVAQKIQQFHAERDAEEVLSDISDSPHPAVTDLIGIEGEGATSAQMFNFNVEEEEEAAIETKVEMIDEVQAEDVKPPGVLERTYGFLTEPMILYDSDESLSSANGGWKRAIRTTRDSVGTLYASLNSLITAVPMGLDSLDAKMEVAFEDFNKTLQDLADAKELHQDDMFGSVQPRMFLDANRSLADAIVALQASIKTLHRHRKEDGEEFTKLSNQVGFLETGLQTAGQNLRGVVVKMATVVRAAIAKANEQHVALGKRIDRLSKTVGSTQSVATVSSLGSDPQDPVDLFTSLLQGNVFGGDASARNMGMPAPTSTGQPMVLGHSSSGAPITAEDLIGAYLKQAEALAECQSKIREMEMSIASKGVKVGDFGFESESELMDLLVKEKVNANAFGTAVDAVSIFCHFKDGHATTQENTAEMKNMRSAGISDAVCLRYVASFRQLHPSYFLNASNTPVSEGQRFPMLENKTVWEGQAPIKGSREKFNKAVQEAYRTGSRYIDQAITTDGII